MSAPAHSSSADPWRLFHVARDAGVTVSPAMPVRTGWITPDITRIISATAPEIVETRGRDFWDAEARQALFPDFDERIIPKADAAGMKEGEAAFMANHIVYAIAVHIHALRTQIARLHGLFFQTLIQEALMRLRRPDWWSERDHRHIVERFVKNRIFELSESRIAAMPAQDIVALHWFFAWRQHTQRAYFDHGIRSIEEAIAWSQEALRNGRTPEEATLENSRRTSALESFGRKILGWRWLAGSERWPKEPR